MKALSGKPKRCRWCDQMFTPARTMQKVCSFECGLDLDRYTKSRVKLKERKEAIKTRSEWLREAQAAFNAYIRERDHDKPCISCGITTGQMHAGHYRSVGACPALRFNPANVHLQCAQCNNHKSGNAIEYRINLVKKIGINLVEWLEQDHQPNKYTIEEIKEIKARYSKMARELKKARAAQ